MLLFLFHLLKVFLLSLAEILHFFDNEKERQAFGTKHALDGMLGASYGKSHENISHWWWLRSMSSGPYAAANIAADLRDDRMESRAIIISQQGCLDYGGVDVNYQDVGIRPAMWIKL